MDHNDRPDSFVDQLSERLARATAGGSSRRSFLGRAARLVFSILGVELLPARPVFAELPAWMFCGAYGKLCSSCPNGTNDRCVFPCITGTGSWRACCADGMGGGQFIDYYDCSTTGAPPMCAKSVGEKGLQCVGGDPNNKPTYGLPAGSNYCCSYAKNTGIPCNP